MWRFLQDVFSSLVRILMSFVMISEKWRFWHHNSYYSKTRINTRYCKHQLILELILFSIGFKILLSQLDHEVVCNSNWTCTLYNTFERSFTGIKECVTKCLTGGTAVSDSEWRRNIRHTRQAWTFSTWVDTCMYLQNPCFCMLKLIDITPFISISYDKHMELHNAITLYREINCCHQRSWYVL